MNNQVTLTPARNIHTGPVPDLAAGDTRAPMTAAPMVYNADNSVAWECMWNSFCALASAGGPPHRGTLLCAQTDADPQHAGYRAAAAEIIRGIGLVSGLPAHAAAPGWIAVDCGEPGKARWLAEQIKQENVQARCAGANLFVPVGEDFTLKGEVKNVITAVAKTTHYWNAHLASEVKVSLLWEEKVHAVGRWLQRWLGR
jgi:sirohydrochlorin cobaltochelatase